MKYDVFFGLVICSFLFSNCNVDNEPIKTSESPLLDKAIQGAGGIENWKNLDSIKFYKTTKLYLADGILEDSTYQLHTYYMYPEMNGKYSWEENNITTEIKYKNGEMVKLINGKVQKINDEEKEKLRLGFLGSQFVMCLPFKLLDSNVQLTEEGKSKLNDVDVEVLKASYNSSNDNHTKSHDWWHYINESTGAHEGYKVHHPPTYAQVINVETTTIGGIRFPLYRKTYRVDEDDNREYLRGEFWYEFVSDNQEQK